MKKKVVLVAFADELTPDWVVSLSKFPADSLVFTGPTTIASAAVAACQNISPNKPNTCAYFALNDTGFEAVLEAMQMLKKQMPNATFIVNVDAASKKLSGAAIASAFSTGSYVGYTSDDEGPSLLSPMKFSYCAKLSPTKHKILSVLSDEPASSLRQLASKVGLPLSLASYHVHGDARSEGLSQMRLLEISRESGRLRIDLAPLGRVYLKGCGGQPMPEQAMDQKILAKQRSKR